jgi:O-antigen/teichoic acid export membrane protein
LKTRQALIYSSLDRYVVYAINLGTMAAAARLLSPRDVGIFTVAHALGMVAGSLRDFGFSAYVIQASEIVKRNFQTAFTISLFMSAITAGAFFASSDAIGRFYAEPGLAPVIRVAAVIFVVDTFFYPQQALLRREMAFGAILAIDVSATAANFIVFWVLALLDARYMSLAWGAFANAAVSTALALVLCPCFWVYRPNLCSWREFLSFGGYFAANGVITVFYSSLPQLIIGRLLQFGAAGFYSRATTLCQVPERVVVTAVQPVVLPAFAEQARSGGSLKESYLRGLGLMTAAQWPALLCLALLAEPVVRVMLGTPWLAVAPLVRVMALGSLMLVPTFLAYPLLLSLGRTKDAFVASAISVPAAGVLVFAAAQVSLEAVAASAILIAPFQSYVALRFVRRRVPFTWGELFGATRKSAVAALSAALAPAAAIAVSGFRFDVPLPLAFAAALGAGLGLLGSLRVTGHPLLVEMRMAGQPTASTLRTAARRAFAALPSRAAANLAKTMGEKWPG